MKPIATVAKSVSVSIPQDVEAGNGRTLQKRAIRRMHKTVKVTSSRVPHPHPFIIIPLILIPLLVGMIGSIVVLSEGLSRPSNEGDVETTTPISTLEAIDMKQVEQVIDDIQKMVTSDDLLREVGKNGEAAEVILVKSLAIIQRFQQVIQASLSYQPDIGKATEEDKAQAKLPISVIPEMNGQGDAEGESDVQKNQQDSSLGDSALLKSNPI